jgi:hypothetical protein
VPLGQAGFKKQCLAKIDRDRIERGIRTLRDRLEEGKRIIAKRRVGSERTACGQGSENCRGSQPKERIP